MPDTPVYPTGTVKVMKLGPGLTFSWKRALGVTAAKRKVSRATGIPLTRSGRRNKLGKFLGMK
jgi:hypothetical protein